MGFTGTVARIGSSDERCRCLALRVTFELRDFRAGVWRHPFRTRFAPDDQRHRAGNRPTPV
jgi:hypothetical protein